LTGLRGFTAFCGLFSGRGLVGFGGPDCGGLCVRDFLGAGSGVGLVDFADLRAALAGVVTRSASPDEAGSGLRRGLSMVIDSAGG
jgi:hypothetical protein